MPLPPCDPVCLILPGGAASALYVWDTVDLAFRPVTSQDGILTLGNPGSAAPTGTPGSQIPGPTGATGPSGADGVGINAFTTVTAGFTVPAVNANVTVAVGQTDFMAIGQVLLIQGAGYYQVAGIQDETDAMLTNLGYATNATVGTAISAAVSVVCSGPIGVSGAAGSGLTSVGLSVPSFLAVSNSPLTANGTIGLASAPGLTANFVLATPNGSAGTLAARALVAADIPALPASKIGSGQLALANGGTGQATASASFNALTPNTTKGDLIVHGTSGDTRLGIGTDGQVLTARSTATNGVDWEAPATLIFSPTTQVTSASYAMLTTDRTLLVNVAASSTMSLLSAPADGRPLTVKDVSNAAGTNNIMILAGSGDTIEGASSVTITTNRGYRQLVYCAASHNWSVIGSA